MTERYWATDESVFRVVLYYLSYLAQTPRVG